MPTKLPALVGQEVTFDAEGPVLEPAQLAEALGVDRDALRSALQAGLVYSVVERGEGEDAGRHRLTLRHRATEAVLVVGADGRVIEASRQGPDAAIHA